MDPCWKDTPEHIIHKILHLACSKLIYRDNNYIEIKKVECKNVDLIDQTNNSKIRDIEFCKDMHFFHRKFKKPIQKIIQGKIFNCSHGLSYNFNNNKYVITYYIDFPSQYKVTRMFIK